MQAFWRISEVPTPFPDPRKKKAAAGGPLRRPAGSLSGAVSHLHQTGQLSWLLCFVVLSRSSSLLSALTCSAALSYIQSAPCIAPHSKPYPAWVTPCALRLYACPPCPWIQEDPRAHPWIYVLRGSGPTSRGSSGDRVRPTWKPSGKSKRAVYRAPIARASLSNSSSVHVHRVSFFWNHDGVTPMRRAASA